MIQIASAPASPAPAAPRAAPVAASGVSGFAVALATLLLPGATEEAGEAGRQAVAEGGKKLPGVGGKADKDADGDADAADATFAWFAAPVAPEPARTGFSAAPAPAQPPVARGVSPEGPAVPAQPLIDAAAAQSGSDEPDPSKPDGVSAASPMPAQPEIGIAPAKTETKPDVQLKADAPKPGAPAQPVAPVPAEIARDIPVASSHAVALPPVAFTLDAPAAPRRQMRDLVDATFAPHAPDAPSAPAVAAPAQMQQAALDTRRHEWMGQMIDRIETMREASSAGDTRIRLAPDALGQVDISIRHEGDRIHVHFATETQAARQLLTDAQPRLSELAEARGVKLGQTSVDSGAANQGQQQTAARQPMNLRPASTMVAEAGADTDQRIA